MKRALIVLIVIFIYLSELKAGHISGGEINYRHLGNGNYEITLRVYRDCQSLQLSNTPINIRCLNNNGTASFSPSKISLRDISGYGQNCNISSACIGGPSWLYGIEEHVWKGTINLNSLNCCELELSWQQCCRSASFTTGMASQNFYVKAFLNKCTSQPNSSVQFSNPPVVLIPRGQDYVFNLGAVDTIDKDEIYTYKLIKGLQGNGNPLSYSGQFNEFRPLTFLGFPVNTSPLPSGFHLHPMLGNLEFRPTRANESGTVAIEVTEWRKINSGLIQVGQTVRDIGYYIVDYGSNRVPVLSASDSNFACVGRPFCLDITTSDGNNNDTVRLSVVNPIRGSTFTNNNNSVRLASGKFCWTPTEGDLRDEPYIFTVTATDNGCPINGKAVRGYAVFVGRAPEASVSTDTLSCGRIVVNYTLDSISSNIQDISAQWLVLDSSGRVRYRSDKRRDTLRGMGGLNIVKLLLSVPNRCVTEMTDTIRFNHLPQVRLSDDSTICSGYQLEIKATSAGGFMPYRYRWSTGNSDTIESIFVVPRRDTAYWVELSDASQCVFRDSVKISTIPSPEFDLGGPYQICTGDTLNLQVDSNFATYFWSNGTTSNKAAFANTGHIWLQTSNLNACLSRDSTYLTVNALPALNLGGNQLVCNADSLVLTSNISKAEYKWSTGDSSQAITVRKNGMYSLIVSDTNGCKNSDSAVIRFGIAPVVNLGADGILCAGESRLLVASPVGMPHTYRWNDASNNRAKLVSSGGKYWVTVMDTAGCAATDTIILGYFDFSYTLSPRQQLMEDDSAEVFAGGVKSAAWLDIADTSKILSRDTIFRFLAKKTQALMVQMTNDSAGTLCQKTDTVVIGVNMRPRIDAPEITQVCEGAEFCIEIETSDLNPVDIVKLNLVDAPDGANFNINNPNDRLPKATLCWNAPVISGADSMVYYTLKVEDNGMPRPNINSQRFGIQLNALPQIRPMITRLECNTFQLDYTLSRVPADSIFKTQWEIKRTNGEMAAVRSNKPDTVALARGFYIAGLRVESKAACESTASENIESLCDGVGISGINADDITIYPNPARDEVWIKIPGCEALEVLLYDLNGKKIALDAEATGDGLWYLNVKGLPAGVYLICVNDGGARYYAKVVVF